MKIFLDSAILDEISYCEKLGILDGVTTNPTLISKTVSSKNEMFDTYKKICEICGEKPVSCEVFSKEKLAFDFANRDSLAFRTVTEKIVDRYIKIEEA